MTINELIRLTPAERAKLHEPPPPRKSTRSTVEDAPKPLDDFFAQRYPRLSFPAAASPETQWRYLVRDQGWARGSAEYGSARKLFETAYDEQFNTAITGFFNDYPDFEYNPRAEAKAEFERLREHKGWLHRPQGRDERNLMNVYRKAREEFFEAFVEDFRAFFGEGDDVRDWEYLCDLLGVRPTPRTIEHCKAALRGYYVNIYDLYYYAHTGGRGKLQRHANVTALSKYSLSKNMLYPLYLAKTTCMKFLLREFEIESGYKWDDWSRKLLTDQEWERVRALRNRDRPRARPVVEVNPTNERSEVVVGRKWMGASYR
ncbi:hypothetical protein DFP73DRAFT_474725 [Morchella snyderi]|nr:hypothetical protein DFP73DRAFT_474725 [Morchella snyderi]